MDERMTTLPRLMWDAFSARNNNAKPKDLYKHPTLNAAWVEWKAAWCAGIEAHLSVTLQSAQAESRPAAADLMREAASQLLTRYLLAFPQDCARLVDLCEQFDTDKEDIFARSNFRGHLTSSLLVLNTPRTHALLIHHRSLNRWLQPGGHVEPGQSLWASACREVTEETGVTALHPLEWTEAGVPFDIDSHEIPANPKKEEPAHWHHDYLFLATADDAHALELQRDEVHDARWVPLERLGQAGSLRLARVVERLHDLPGQAA